MALENSQSVIQSIIEETRVGLRKIKISIFLIKKTQVIKIITGDILGEMLTKY